MYIYISYIYIHTCMHVHAYVHAYIYICMHIYIKTLIHYTVVRPYIQYCIMNTYYIFCTYAYIYICTCAHTEYKTCSLPSPTSRRSLQPRSGRSTPPGLEQARDGSKRLVIILDLGDISDI